MPLPTDNISTTTLKMLRNRYVDNIMKGNPSVAYFLSKNRVETVSGGTHITEPLMYTTNNTVQPYRGYDRFNMAPTEELTEAKYGWRQLAVSIGISGLEQLMNAGTSKIFDILKAKIRIAEMSQKQYLDQVIHKAAALKDTAKEIIGLDEIVEEAVGSSQGTLGGISRVTYPWWQSKFKTYTVAASDKEGLNSAFVNFYNVVGEGVDNPDLIITDQDVYERYENDNRDKVRLSNMSMLNIGFDNQMFKGATMMWNQHIKSATGSNAHLAYFINSEFLRFVVHKEANFKMLDFRAPLDQDAIVSQILFAGNMTNSQSRRHGCARITLSP